MADSPYTSAFWHQDKMIYEYNHDTRELKLGEGHTAESALILYLECQRKWYNRAEERGIEAVERALNPALNNIE